LPPLTHVINITDVGHLTSDMDEGEDKLELASREEARSVLDLAAHYTGAFLDDMAKLRVLPPAAWAKATDHIHEMVEFARVLEENGYAYKIPAGLYSTPRRFATTESSRSSIQLGFEREPGSRRRPGSETRATSPEIAQSEAYLGGPWAPFWLHNEFLNLSSPGAAWKGRAWRSVGCWSASPSAAPEALILSPMSRRRTGSTAPAGRILSDSTRQSRTT
jgi:hypothetical protein